MSGKARAERPKPPLDAPRLLEVLIKHKVRFVVIGGYGAVMHGVELDPPTTDADITPQGTSKNLRRLVAALQELDAKLFHDDVAGTEIPPFYNRPEDLLEPINKAVMLVTDHGVLDIVMRPDGFADAYPVMARDSVMLHAVDATGNPVELEVPVASVAHIHQSKKAAGRRKDRKHLPALARAMIREVKAKRTAAAAAGDDLPPEAVDRLQAMKKAASPKPRGGPGTNKHVTKPARPPKPPKRPT